MMPGQMPGGLPGQTFPGQTPGYPGGLPGQTVPGQFPGQPPGAFGPVAPAQVPLAGQQGPVSSASANGGTLVHVPVV
jgi:hypothetical protein